MKTGNDARPIGATERIVLPDDPIERLPVPTRYIGYRSLLVTHRAVKRRGIYLTVTSAGTNPQRHRLTCASKVESKRLGVSIVTELNKTRSDDEYNRVLVAILADIRRAWPREPKIEHVHSCENERCGVDASGQHACGFDWREHQLTLDCACGPVMDQGDAGGEWHFIVHRDMRGRTKVYV